MKNCDNLVYIATHAEEIFLDLIWPDGPTCPCCKSHSYYKMGDGRYKCKDCGKIYSPKTDTIFHRSHVSLANWLIALYLMLDGKGISSIELGRKIGVTQKTAWFMLCKLRFMFDQSDTVLEGEIAMDEVYVGGTWKNFCLKKRQALLSKYKLPQHPKTVKEKMALAQAVNCRYKSPVFGMNDGEKLVLRVMPNPVVDEDVISIFNTHTLNEGWSVSDCSHLYDNWKLMTGYDISHNNHSKGQYVAEDGRSSNRIEGEFSWVKRGTVFNHVHMSKRLLQLYLNEHAFRFCNRAKSIIEKLRQAFQKVRIRFNRDDLKAYNSLSGFPIRQENWFDPWEFFKTYPIREVVRNGVVYRAEEFCC